MTETSPLSWSTSRSQKHDCLGAEEMAKLLTKAGCGA